MEQNSGKPGLVFHASEEKLEKLETQIELPDRVRVRSANIVSNRVQNKTLELRAFKKKTIRTIPGLPHICTLLRWEAKMYKKVSNCNGCSQKEPAPDRPSEGAPEKGSTILHRVQVPPVQA